MPKRTPPPDGDNVVPLPPRARHVFTPGESAKGLAAAKARNHKPARGGPPRSTRDDKSGAGWGGAANGPGDRRPMTPQHPEHVHNLPPEVRAAKALAKATRIEALVENLIIHAFDPEVAPASRISATVAALNREEGLPVARQINADATGLEGWVLDSLGEPRKDRAG